MENFLKWFGLALVGMTVILFTAVVMPNQEATQRANGYKIDNCVKYADAIGVDANDAKRSETIEACYNGK